MPGLTAPNQVGVREDLSDVIMNVDAHATPIFSMIPKGAPLKNTLFDWQADAFDSPSVDGVVDGSDVTSFENRAKNRRRLYGRAHKISEPWMVSDFAENVNDVAGLTSEKAASIAHCLTVAKRAIECVLGSDNESQEDDGTVGYETRGLGKWIQNGAQTDLPVSAEFRTPTGSIDTTAMASLTDTIVQNVLQSIWSETGSRKRYAFPCGPDLKRVFTDSTLRQAGVSTTVAALRTFNQDAASRQIIQTVDVFIGDFGELELIPTIWLGYGTANAPDHRGYVLDMEQLSLRFQRMPGSVELENKGGGPRGYIDAIFGLEVKSPLGLGKFAATS